MTPRTARTPDWGDGAALFAFSGFAALAPTLWIATPDFVFHWGLKGERFFLARGVDYDWLAKGWNWVIHPDYPNLPESFDLYRRDNQVSGGSLNTDFDAWLVPR